MRLEFMRHHFNALHVYAFLYPYLGMDKARSVAIVWEILVHPILYPNILMRKVRRMYEKRKNFNC